MPPLIGRFVQFVAVAVANAINIPLMRQRELRYGIPVVDEEDKRLGMSKVYRQIDKCPHMHAQTAKQCEAFGIKDTSTKKHML